jgi:hypothetical protein
MPYLITLHEYKDGTEEISPTTMVVPLGIYMLCYLRVATEGRRSSYQTQRTGTRTYLHIRNESTSANWPSLGSLDQATASARLTILYSYGVAILACPNAYKQHLPSSLGLGSSFAWWQLVCASLVPATGLGLF